MGLTTRCECGRLRAPASSRCCGRCAEGWHNTACGMRQVTLADAAGTRPDPRFAFHVAPELARAA